MPATSSRPRPPASAFVPPAQRSSASFEDDDSTSDDSGDEAAALEMDGQELWAQNYCATCDCLIEPGQGVGVKRSDPTRSAMADTASTATPSTARAAATAATAATASGLKSRNGTIKARPPSAEAGLTRERIGGGGGGAAAAALKRTHSAGRLHAVGASGALGQHKRTGSAAGRLNALSDLKPTTKLNADDDRPNGKAKSNDTSKQTPALSRRNSAVSTKSGGSGAASGPASPAGSTSALPRTKKGGLLAGLTPAALRQEEEAAKAPAALYCSERCRLIDEQRSAGLGELAQYLSQPTMQSPAPSAVWASPSWGPTVTSGGSNAWPRRVPSMTSMPSSVMAFNGMVRTPESECMCHECMDRSSSASGTVQSGASDTTESSVSYAYGVPGRQKQRTTSGRIVTPHNLQAHPSHIDSYFPALPAGALSARRLSARDSPKLRPVTAVATRPPLVGSGTDSSEGSRSPWDLTARQPSPPSQHGDRVTPRSPRNTRSGRARSSTGASEELHGTVTTGTNTPAATVVGEHRSSSPRVLASAVLTPIPCKADHGRNSTSTRPNSMHTSSSSFTANASPLRLLRRGDHHAEASVESSTDYAHSPHTTNLLSSSIVSNSAATELASSATTLGARANASSIVDRRAAHGRAMPEGLTLSASGSNSSSVVNLRRVEHNAEQQSLDRLSSSLGAPSAMARLKEAAAKTSAAALPALGEVREGRIEHHRGGSESAQHRSSWARDERRSSLASTNGSVGSASTGWLRSLTSAWATIRGTPSTANNSDDDAVSRTGSSSAGRRNSVTFSDAQAPPQYARSSSSRRGSSGSATRGSLLSPAIGSLTALSTLDARSRGADPTPTQSFVTKPDVRRGSVPAFATDIGRSGIPGDQLPIMSVSPGRDGGRSKMSRSLASSERRKSSETRDPSADEERRRRKAEHRHQRSRDVTVLPPLLGPNSRTQSSSNMHNSTRPHSTRTQSTTSSSGNGRSRSRAGSQGQSAYVQIGSAGSYAAAQHARLSRPTTPSLRKSPRSASGSASGEASYSYSNPPSAGTSPRRAGLGWGAMTAITPAPDFVHPHVHGHSSSLSLGHAAMAARGLNAPAGYQHAAHVHQPHHHGHPHVHGHVARPVHGHRPAATMQLGHVGLLGAHPHGHGPVYGRHATTPVRSSTPRVPEDGGEMSSAALTGEAEGPNRPRSAMGQQRGSGSSSMAPPRPRSVIAMRAVSGGMQPLASPTTMVPPSPGMAPPLTAAAVLSAQSQQQHNRTWSYEALPGLKTYPVLQLPGRETHDQYDAGWGLGEGGLEEMLTGRRTPAPTAQTANSAANGDAQHNTADQIPRMPKRKTLFYFDQS